MIDFGGGPALSMLEDSSGAKSKDKEKNASFDMEQGKSGCHNWVPVMQLHNKPTTHSKKASAGVQCESDVLTIQCKSQMCMFRSGLTMLVPRTSNYQFEHASAHTRIAVSS